MFAYINGKLAYKDPAFVVIDVGGVGYEIKITLNTYAVIKEKASVKLYTYAHIKEDGHTLYGFVAQAEKRLFMNLISISGVGPSTGIMILSSLTPEEIRHAIINEQVDLIQSVKGIGAKTAQRIILELKDKLKKDGQNGFSMEISGDSHNSIRDEALSALTTLGINKNIAEKAIVNHLKNAEKDITVEELIKRVLKSS